MTILLFTVYCVTYTKRVNRMQYSSTTLMYWILFVVLSNSLSTERQTIMSDWSSDISNNTRVSASIINNDTEENRSEFKFDNVTSSAFETENISQTNNETENISSTEIFGIVRSSKRLGFCVYYDINGSLTAGWDWLHKLNTTLDDGSMSYDDEWCWDMRELYMSTVYLTEPGECIYYNVNGTRTASVYIGFYSPIYEFDSSMSYDNKWCRDMRALYLSIYYACLRLDQLDTLDVIQIIIHFYML